MRWFFLFLLALGATPAFAACIATGPDGDIDEESCAQTQVTLGIPALAHVMRLAPFDLGKFDYENAPMADNDFCIWYNTEKFAMTLTSLNTQGNNRFYLTGTSKNQTVAYNVVWYTKAGLLGREYDLSQKENETQHDLSLPMLPGSLDCVQPNVSMQITVPIENLQDKPEDRYSDTLTVTVAVE